MQVPKRIHVSDGSNKQKVQVPAGYYSDSDSDNFNSDFDDFAPPPPPVPVRSPRRTLTVDDITEEEKSRHTRNEPSNRDHGFPVHLDESIDKMNDDTMLKNMTSFQAGDPVCVARQVRHLHNRVKLLEAEVQTHQNRQIFMFGILSMYILSSGIKWMLR